MRLLPKGADPALGAIVAEGFFSRLSFGIANAALGFYAVALGVSLGEIGALAAINVLGALVVKPATGWLADRYGLKRSFEGAILLRSLVGLLYIFAVTPLQLIAIKVLYGVSQGVRDPALNALIAERGGKKSIASAFAWYATAKNVAGNVGTAMAGFLIGEYFRLSFSTVFLIAFALSILPFVVVVLGIKESPAGGPTSDASGAKPAAPKPSGSQAETKEARRIRQGALVRELAFVREFGLTASAERSPDPRGLIPVGTWLYPTAPVSPSGAGSPALSTKQPNASETAKDKPATGKGISTGTIISYIGLGVLISGTAQMLKGPVFTAVGVKFAGLTPDEIGAISIVSGLVSLGAGPFFGWLADGFSRRLVLAVRGIANTFSSAVFVLFPSFVGFTIGDSIDEVGKAAFKPAWGALMADVANFDRARRARTMGYLSVAEDIGEFLGPLIFTSLAALWWYPAAFGVRVLLAGATELYASRLHRPTERPKPVGKLTPVKAVADRRT